MEDVVDTETPGDPDPVALARLDAAEAIGPREPAAILADAMS
jgi:hypothetical protein